LEHIPNSLIPVDNKVCLEKIIHIIYMHHIKLFLIASVIIIASIFAYNYQNNQKEPLVARHQNLENKTVRRTQLVYIASIDTNNGQTIINGNSVELLKDAEAQEAGFAAGVCPQIEECPTLFLSPRTNATDTYAIAKNSAVTLAPVESLMARPEDTGTITFTDFEGRFRKLLPEQQINTPFELTIENGVVTNITERYFAF
jgi:hypothetical protein